MRTYFIVVTLFCALLFSCKKGTQGRNGTDGTDGTDGANGTNGKNSLIDFVTEPAGTNCANGGYKVLSGIDLNGNSVLDASEVQVTKYLCNGTNGNGGTGSNGRNSLISFVTESAGTNCAKGGYKVTSGVDTNGNNVLDAAEVQTTAYICNGNDGLSTLTSVVAEAAGANCASGGFKISAGLDINRNNVLDNSEVQSTQYICNAAGGTGTNGYNSLVDVVPEPIGANCAGGGTRINYGTDMNRNNVLDQSEISKTSYMCNANRVYATVVSQQGTGAPVGVPLVNNLGVTVTWSRTAAGKYTGTISPAINTAKTLVLSNNTNVTTTLISGNTINLENVCSTSPITYCDNFLNVTVGLLVVD
ncbi:DUF7151 family protein [Niabella hibiscisoli]|uniref:DUF7151 family protein n=1 Tax=Niabella hibiscisoli TaxID=1825928 RepID=UPI001F0EBEC7|nr:hypothetical protein [Niabella hibiscisoli]MCH5715170.1 hypothetical protein [Niabella hibiscisoli]